MTDNIDPKVEAVARGMATKLLEEVKEKIASSGVKPENTSAVQEPWKIYGFNTEEEYNQNAWKHFISSANVAVSVMQTIN